MSKGSVTDRARHRAAARTGSRIVRVVLAFIIAGGLACVPLAFSYERLELLPIGFGSALWGGLAMLFCRMADVLADISELLDD